MSDFWSSAFGQIDAQLTGAEPEKTLQMLNQQGIDLYHVKAADDLTREFTVPQKDFRRAVFLAQKRGDTLRVRRKSGVYWKIRRLSDRPILLTAAVLLLILTIIVPTRVLFIQVEGSSRVPPAKILEAAQESGIYFGAARKKVRSERVKNALLAAVPQLQWAGVNTSGCVATIRVRERAEEAKQPDSMTLTRIIADRDGYILRATATKGNLLVVPGQAVKKGQTLISAYTDCGMCLRATRAEGEITAQTKRNITVRTPANYLRREPSKETRLCVNLIFQKKRINLWNDSGIWDATCGRISKEYAMYLPGGFRLPFSLQFIKTTCYSLVPANVFLPETEASVSSFARAYLGQQMVAGKIMDAQESFFQTDDGLRMDAVYTSEEMIGRERTEQIGETNGEDR